MSWKFHIVLPCFLLFFGWATFANLTEGLFPTTRRFGTGAGKGKKTTVSYKARGDLGKKNGRDPGCCFDYKCSLSLFFGFFWCERVTYDDSIQFNAEKREVYSLKKKKKGVR